MFLRRLAVAGALIAATTAGTLGTAGAAQADTGHNGVCDTGSNGELCLYWDSNLGGSFHDYYAITADFGSDVFLSAGAGRGQRVKNNSASALNNWYTTARVYYNENYGGPYDDVPAYSSRNLLRTWNDNASFNWV
ncbi:peptidase inhibitor family I36 protein [Streptomyces sp. NPDC014986]|uniref:peptidase inhibitor family I36 protein n=1 Tax=Streptomyces sp. NPDC014986 TaxID=3364934 RepID=UPI0036F880B3